LGWTGRLGEDHFVEIGVLGQISETSLTRGTRACRSRSISDRSFALQTPLMWLDKAETWALAQQLGGEPLIEILLEHTHACYRNERGPRCGPLGPCLVPVWPWGPGGQPLMAPSGVAMIGLALVLRDLVQRRLGRLTALLAIAAGAVLSGAIAPPALVVASTSAFFLSELADFAIYTPLQERGLVIAVLGAAWSG